MPVLTPNFFAARFAAMTIPSPRLPPPTQTARSCNLGFNAISQLAKKLSPSTCKIRMGILGFTSRLLFEPKYMLCQIFAQPPGQKLSNQIKKREGNFLRACEFKIILRQNNLVAFFQSDNRFFPIRSLTGLRRALATGFAAHIHRVDARDFDLE